MFWDNFYTICKEHNKTPTDVVEELGIARGSITKWKNGSMPSGKNLKKITDYFGVSTSAFFVEKEKSPSGIPDRLLKILSENPAKLQLAMLICEWDDEKLSRAIKLLDASLLLPKSDD